MKLNQMTNVVEMGNQPSNLTSFSIVMNAKAFKVLSDTMYQDKIGSIVREISCNAYDSHVQAGKAAVPFEIHIPTAFEPWFSVKDYGVGLTPDAMANVFTQYFNSTKDNSNDMIGAFGLGSKSWASYTDQATITSITDGVKRIYTAFISSEGMPALTELSSSPTDEGNGVELAINVNKEHYAEFAKAVASQLRFFTVKPKIVNDSNFEFEKIDDELEVSTQSIDIRKSRSHYSNNIYVIQGQVGYPLYVHNVRNKLATMNRDALDFLGHISNAGTVHLYFNIGEIEVTASREAISYNQFTYDNIVKKLLAARDELLDEVKSKIANFVADWDAASYINSNPTISKLAKAVKLDVKGLTLQGNTYCFDGRSVCADVTDPNNPKMLCRIHSYSPASPNGTLYSGFQVIPNEKMVLMVRDTAKSPVNRIREYVAKHGVTAVVFNDSFGTGIFTDDFIEKLSKVYGDAEFMRVSDIDLEVKPKTPRMKGAYTKSTYYGLGTSHSTSIRQWIKAVSALEDIADPVLYTTFADGHIDNRGDGFDIIRTYNIIKNNDLCDMDLIAVKPENVKKLKNGIEAKTWLKAVIDKHTDHPLLKEYAECSALVDAYANSGFTWHAEWLNEHGDMLNKNTILYSFIEKMVEAKKRVSEICEDNGFKLAWSLSSILPTISEAKRKECEVVKIQANVITNKYSLLRAINSWNFDGYKDHIITYVNAVGY